MELQQQQYTQAHAPLKQDNIAFMAEVPPSQADATPPPKSPGPAKPSQPFWGEDPNVLFHSPAFFPTQQMDTSEQFNAITRMIILLSFFLFLIMRRLSFLLVGAATMFGIYLIFWNRKRMEAAAAAEGEGFENPVLATLKEQGLPLPPDDVLYDSSTPVNPMSNLLISDIEDNPMKRPAPPVEKYEDDILESAKAAVQLAHPTFPDIADRLFRNLGDNYQMEQSMQRFTSNPSTTLPNDQQAFSDFLYGDMISCKEGNVFACARNNVHYNLF
jgi:hypothetical protein